MSGSGGGATMTTISGLMASTTYSIEVAAVNSAGTGMHWNAQYTGMHWNALECTVRYGVQGSGSTQTVIVSGPGTMDIDICGLTAHTSYAVEVAAENADGIGVYSDPLTVDTPQS